VTDRRDRAIDALLGRRPPAGGERTSGVCLDPDTVAAWFDGVLPDEARAAAEAHAASCARCQSLLAVMARTEPVVETHARWWHALGMRWLVPAMAAAAAVALWLAVVPHDRVLAPPAPITADKEREAPPQPAAPDEAKAASPQSRARPPVSPQPATTDQLTPSMAKSVAPPATADKKETVSSRADATAKTLPEPLLKSARAAQAPAAADSGLRQQRLELVSAPIEIASPDPAFRWRVQSNGTIEHSSDSGATWASQGASPPALVTSGSSPSHTVAWFVGRAGLVLVTSDEGVTWQRRDIGQPVDLVSVRPVDDKTATVVAADGRQFTTHDAGVTWTPAGLQEIPAAPF
jgi:hypothetical protein